MLNSLLFDSRRYDLAKVGRYKYNMKLGLSSRIEDAVVAKEDIVDPLTGEILAEVGQRIDSDLAMAIEDAGVEYVWCESKELESDAITKVIGNRYVDPAKYVDLDPYKLSE